MKEIILVNENGCIPFSNLVLEKDSARYFKLLDNFDQIHLKEYLDFVDEEYIGDNEIENIVVWESFEHNILRLKNEDVCYKLINFPRNYFRYNWRKEEE